MMKCLLCVAGIILVKSIVVFFLWNALVPVLFHGPTLGALQAVGLTVLAMALFGSHGYRHHQHKSHSGKSHCHSVADEKQT
jgi:hypothetical protein